MIPARLEVWVKAWRLQPDGESIVTPSSLLLPVLADGIAAMLKVALIDEEVRGGEQMAWWAGRGTAPVLASEGGALLMNRAPGGSLALMVKSGGDQEATSIICRLAQELHRAPPTAGLELLPLEVWFAPLLQGAMESEELTLARDTARRLISRPLDEVALHGDLHHENVLDFGSGDWRVIDPKGLRGERTFDFVHLLRNPDAVTVTTPGRLQARVAQIAAEAGVSTARLLAWTVAFSGLSATWNIEDGGNPSDDLKLLRRSRALLNLAGKWE